jgi:hypothetical protein
MYHYTMMLNIPDHLPGTEKDRILTCYPVVYALKKCHGSIKQAAEFLGLSERGLRWRININVELKMFVNKRDIEYDEHLKERFNDLEKKDPIRKIYLFHLRKSEGSFWFEKLTDAQKEEVKVRIKKLYYD